MDVRGIALLLIWGEITWQPQISDFQAVPERNGLAYPELAVDRPVPSDLEGRLH